MLGNCCTGSVVSARTPTSTITRFTTIASTGCLMKMSVNARMVDVDVAPLLAATDSRLRDDRDQHGFAQLERARTPRPARRPRGRRESRLHRPPALRPGPGAAARASCRPCPARRRTRDRRPDPCAARWPESPRRAARRRPAPGRAPMHRAAAQLCASAIVARTVALRVVGSTRASIARIVATTGSALAVRHLHLVAGRRPAATCCATVKSTYAESSTPCSVVRSVPSFRY